MNIKNIMIFTGGIGVGSLAGYIFCKKTLEDKYRMDVKDNRQYYLEKLEELGVMEEGFEAETMDEDEEEEFYEKDMEILLPVRYIRHRCDLHGHDRVRLLWREARGARVEQIHDGRQVDHL